MLVLIFAVITVDNHHITCQLFATRELALSYTQDWLNAHGFIAIRTKPYQPAT